MANSQIVYALIAIAAGASVPFLASINAAYGQAIGNVYWASITLCLISLLTLGVITLFSGNAVPSGAALGQASWWHFSAGIFFTVYVVSITYVAPKIGLGNAIIFVIVAQILTAVIIDHFGLLGVTVHPLDWKRALGIVLLVAGIALAKSQPATTAAN